MKSRLLLAALLIPLLATHADDKEAEEAALAAVKKLGGSVVRSSKLPGNPVTTVYLSGKKVTDADLKVLAGLKHLDKMQNLMQLHLYQTNVSDEGLKELAGLKSLWVLSVGKTKVTQAGAEKLKKELPSISISR
jgi:internalin A